MKNLLIVAAGILILTSTAFADGNSVGGGGNAKGNKLLDNYLDENKISQEEILLRIEPYLAPIRDRIPGLSLKIRQNIKMRNYYFVDDSFVFSRYGERETGVFYNTEQVAVQNDRNVFIRRSIFEKMDKKNQDSLFVHEGLMTDYVESQLIKRGSHSDPRESIGYDLSKRFEAVGLGPHVPAPSKNIEPRDVLEMTPIIMSADKRSESEIQSAALRLNFGSYASKEVLSARREKGRGEYRKRQEAREAYTKEYTQRVTGLAPQMARAKEILRQAMEEHAQLCRTLGYPRKSDPTIALPQYLELQKKTERLTKKIATDVGLPSDIYNHLTEDGVENKLRYKLRSLSDEQLAMLMTGVLLRARYQIDYGGTGYIASWELPQGNAFLDYALKKRFPERSSTLAESIEETKKEIKERGEEERVTFGCPYVMGDERIKERMFGLADWQKHEKKYGGIDGLVSSIARFNEMEDSHAFLDVLYSGWQEAEKEARGKKPAKVESDSESEPTSVRAN